MRVLLRAKEDNTCFVVNVATAGYDIESCEIWINSVSGTEYIVENVGKLKSVEALHSLYTTGLTDLTDFVTR